MQMVEHRRTTRLALAKRNLAVAEESNLRQSEACYRAIWYDWNSHRYALQQSLVDEANTKRRRLDREKRAIERPRVEDLPSVLRLYAPPAYHYYEKKATVAYGQDYSVEFDVHDNKQRKHKRGAVGLDEEEIQIDLQMMGVSFGRCIARWRTALLSSVSRSQLREGLAIPPQLNYLHEVGHTEFPPADVSYGMLFDPHTTVYGGAGNDQPPHPLAASGRTMNSVLQQQQQAGRGSDPFSSYRVVPTSHSLPPTPLLAQAPHMYLPRHRPSLDEHLATANTSPKLVSAAEQVDTRGDAPSLTAHASASVNKVHTRLYEAASTGQNDPAVVRYMSSYYPSTVSQAVPVAASR